MFKLLMKFEALNEWIKVISFIISVVFLAFCVLILHIETTPFILAIILLIAAALWLIFFVILQIILVLIYKKDYLRYLKTKYSHF
jgi:hypothetical protein